MGTITYVANADRRFPEERVEVFGGAAIAVLDNFRRLEPMQCGRRQTCGYWLEQDKGRRGEWEDFSKAIKAGNMSPHSF